MGIWLLYTHVEYLARAKVYALNCTDPEHEVLLVVTEDVSSRAMSSQHWAEYDADPYRVLVNGGGPARAGLETPLQVEQLCRQPGFTQC